MSITIYQTSQNCTHVHPGERREAHRKILTKILILFIYIPSSLRQSTSISLYLKSFYKLQAASYSTHKRDKDTSWHQWICFFFQTSSCISISLLCRTNCGQYLVVSYGILLCLTSTKPDTSSWWPKSEKYISKCQETLFFLLYMKAASQCLTPFFRSVWALIMTPKILIFSRTSSLHHHYITMPLLKESPKTQERTP